MKRRTKQGVIIFLYLFFLTLFLGGIFWLFFYQPASCTDQKQNQDETGVDCGGKCSEYCLADLASRPIRVKEVTILPYTEGSSDAVAVLVNQNSKAALRSAQYVFSVTDASGKVLTTKKGSVSLLPLEEKTVVALGLPVALAPGTAVSIALENEEWIAFIDFEGEPDITVVNQRFGLLSGEAGYAEATGLVQNKSPYDIRSLLVNVVFRDSSGKPISVNQTTMNTLQSSEERDFRLLWPRQFEGQIAKAEMSIDFDMLKSDAFVKQFFPGGQFQELAPGR
jgi:hypothetical protein